jgi:hypothetical protein
MLRGTNQPLLSEDCTALIQVDCPAEEVMQRDNEGLGLRIYTSRYRLNLQF